jgi:hypothetical protein
MAPRSPFDRAYWPLTLRDYYEGVGCLHLAYFSFFLLLIFPYDTRGLVHGVSFLGLAIVNTVFFASLVI